MPVPTRTVKYVGGLDEVTVYFPSTDTSYRVTPGATIQVVATDAELLLGRPAVVEGGVTVWAEIPRNPDWEDATPASAAKKGDS